MQQIPVYAASPSRGIAAVARERPPVDARRSGLLERALAGRQRATPASQ